jgi:dihydropteroate synthase
MLDSPKTYRFSWSGYNMEFGRRTCIMGVVNVTPDSFSDGGKFFARDAAVAQGQKLAADGADILDIGGESTRPFSDPVSADAEIERVIPVIEKLADQLTIPISIDTMKAEVARRAIDAGASMINDVSALRFDPAMGEVARQFETPVVLMHMLGSPKTMQDSPAYDNLIADISDFLKDAIERAQKQGISKSKLIVDPGIGFGKTVSHNLFLIRHLSAFAALEVQQNNDIPPDLPIVETGTQAAVAAAVLCGAHIVRVHDAASTRATIRILDAIRSAQDN